MPVTTFAISYARFSPRPDADTSESCELQHGSNIEWMERKGYTLAGRYEDPDVSGDDDERDGLWDAIKALKRGWVLVVFTQSRLARSGMLLYVIEAKVKERGARIEYVMGINGEGPEIQMVRAILAAVDEYRKKADAKLTSWATRRHQNNGKRMTRPERVPYGQALDPADPKRTVPNPAEQAIIERMASMHAAGAGPFKIASVLMAERVSFRGKLEWHANTVRRILERLKR